MLAQAAPEPADQDFAPAARAVVELLKDKDSAKFASTLAPSLEDWRAALSTNHSNTGENKLGPSFQKSLERTKNEVEATAKRLLAKAAELKLDFSEAKISARTKAPPIGSMRRDDLQDEGESLPWTKKLEVVLVVEPPPGGPARPQEEYKVTLHELVHFPGGWRCSEGVQWAALPSSVADEKTRVELAVQQRAAANEGLTHAEDPALTRLGETVLGLLRSRDPKALEDEALDREQRAAVSESARRVLDQMERYGINFDGAVLELKEVSFAGMMPRKGLGQTEGVEGNQLRVGFSAKSPKTGRTGTSLSGEYALIGDEVLRKAGQWHLSAKIQWSQLPEGILDEKAAAELKLENYVAEHDTLPPGLAAPDIEFVHMDDQKRMHLTDLRGKVVVLDFWAVNCGPCQEPLQKMQKYLESNPGWKGRVELVPISIDDRLKDAQVHLQRHGWTNTFNVWAGPRGWNSAPARAFRISGIPTCYVIDAAGTIVEAGHPGLMDVPAIVSGAIK
jgi:thiol-disulfide isomerase/thioredoxin